MSTEAGSRTDNRDQGRPVLDRTSAVLLASALRTHLQRQQQMGIPRYPLTPELDAFLHPKPQRPQGGTGPGRPKQAVDRGHPVTPPVAEMPTGPADHLPDLHREIGCCRQCALASARIGQVLGQGKTTAPLVVVGDYCRRVSDAAQDCLFGVEEDALLWKMMQAIGMGRGDVYVTNVVKCTPRADSVPERTCEQSCQGFVQREIALVRPRLILAMGEAAARAVLGVEGSVLRLRGRLHPSSFRDRSDRIIPVMVSLHPRYLLAQPAMKKAAWQDLQIVQRQLQALPEQSGVSRAGR